MISLLITVVIFAVICYVLFWALGYLGCPEPIRRVITVIIVLIAVVWLLSTFAGGNLGFGSAHSHYFTR